METLAARGVMELITPPEIERINRANIQIRNYIEGPECELVAGARISLMDVIELANNRRWDKIQPLKQELSGPQRLATIVRMQTFTELMHTFMSHACSRFNDHLAKLSSQQSSIADSIRFFSGATDGLTSNDKAWQSTIQLFQLLHALVTCRFFQTPRFASLCADHDLPTSVLKLMAQIHFRPQPSRSPQPNTKRHGSDENMRRSGSAGGANGNRNMTTSGPNIDADSDDTSVEITHVASELNLHALALASPNGETPSCIRPSRANTMVEADVIAEGFEDVFISQPAPATPAKPSSGSRFIRSETAPPAPTPQRNRLPIALTPPISGGAIPYSIDSIVAPVVSSATTASTLKPTISSINLAHTEAALASGILREDDIDASDEEDDDMSDNDFDSHSHSPHSLDHSLHPDDDLDDDSGATPHRPSATHQDPVTRLKMEIESQIFQLLTTLSKSDKCIHSMCTSDALKHFLLLQTLPHVSSAAFRSQTATLVAAISSTAPMPLFNYVIKTNFIGRVLQTLQPIFKKRDKYSIGLGSGLSLDEVVRSPALRNRATFQVSVSFLHRLRSLMGDSLTLLVYLIRTASAIDAILATHLLEAFEKSGGLIYIERLLADWFPLPRQGPNATRTEQVLADKLLSQLRHLVLLGHRDIIPMRDRPSQTPSPLRTPGLTPSNSVGETPPLNISLTSSSSNSIGSSVASTPNTSIFSSPRLTHARKPSTAVPASPSMGANVPAGGAFSLPSTSSTQSFSNAPSSSHVLPSVTSCHIRNTVAYSVLHRLLASSSSTAVRTGSIEQLRFIFEAHGLNAQSAFDHTNLDTIGQVIALLETGFAPSYEDEQSDTELRREAWQLLDVIMQRQDFSITEARRFGLSVTVLEELLRTQHMHLLQQLAGILSTSASISSSSSPIRIECYRWLHTLLIGALPPSDEIDDPKDCKIRRRYYQELCRSAGILEILVEHVCEAESILGLSSMTTGSSTFTPENSFLSNSADALESSFSTSIPLPVTIINQQATSSSTPHSASQDTAMSEGSIRSFGAARSRVEESLTPLFETIYLLLVNNLSSQSACDQFVVSIWRRRERQHVHSDPSDGSIPSSWSRTALSILNQTRSRAVRAVVLRVIGLVLQSRYVAREIHDCITAASAVLAVFQPNSSTASNEQIILATHGAAYDHALGEWLDFVSEISLIDVELKAMCLSVMNHLCQMSAPTVASMATLPFPSIQRSIRRGGALKGSNGFEIIMNTLQHMHAIKDALASVASSASAVDDASPSSSVSASSNTAGSALPKRKLTSTKRLRSASDANHQDTMSPQSTNPVSILILLYHLLGALSSLLRHNPRHRSYFFSTYDPSLIDASILQARLASPKHTPIICIWIAYVSVEQEMNAFDESSAALPSTAWTTAAIEPANMPDLMTILQPANVLDFHSTMLPDPTHAILRSPDAILPFIRLLPRCPLPAQHRLLTWLFSMVRGNMLNAKALASVGGVRTMIDVFRGTLTETPGVREDIQMELQSEAPTLQSITDVIFDILAHLLPYTYSTIDIHHFFGLIDTHLLTPYQSTDSSK